MILGCIFEFVMVWIRSNTIVWLAAIRLKWWITNDFFEFTKIFYSGFPIIGRFFILATAVNIFYQKLSGFFGLCGLNRSNILENWRSWTKSMASSSGKGFWRSCELLTTDEPLAIDLSKNVIATVKGQGTFSSFSGFSKF